MRHIWLIPLIPLASALVLLALGPRVARAAGWVGSAAVAAAFGVSLMAFGDLLSQDEGSRSYVLRLFEWASVGDLRIPISLKWDPLAAVMCLTVTGVGFLIHLYSIEYMRDDPRFARFFAYLNLFVFSMLTLVLGESLIVLFAGWELVGLCSYLLIGFWFERPAAATAAKKAFLVTRIGDTGFLIGIFLLFATLGTLDITTILRAVQGHELAAGTATAVALLLFAGAVGKSAQLPLYVWLPDAMEGPTPVSALIHAATMVTAGVYLVVRLNPLFLMSPTAMTVVAVIGAATMIYTALLAVAEDDIKRVLAYSTISQLGYMFLAVGVGAFGAAIFHLVTHAFFKALLFLAAGSVMHGLGGETMLDRMGALRRSMPRTFALTAIGWAAISGILPFAGFFSKDLIVASVWASHRTALFVIAILGAGLTAFYMSRLLFLAFAGKQRWSEGTHAHESPALMVLPMAVLAVLSIGGGLLNLPEPFPRAGMLGHFLAPIVGEAEHHEGAAAVTAILWAIAATGVVAAWWTYSSGLERRTALRRRLGPVSTLLRNRFFVDEIYATLIVAPARLVAAFLAYVFDARVVDGLVNGAGGATSWSAAVMRRLQSGMVRAYAVGVLAGGAALVVWFAWRGV
ncbi:MAG TPA: NADH-quinone oxidoreductase subunit L [Actinomycetota bacterium]|nr:NADH-quinone oxidoreductase subunit L [Actinomycetota bacterium]